MSPIAWLPYIARNASRDEDVRPRLVSDSTSALRSPSRRVSPKQWRQHALAITYGDGLCGSSITQLTLKTQRQLVGGVTATMTF